MLEKPSRSWRALTAQRLLSEPHLPPTQMNNTYAKQNVNEGFDRLQRLLLAMRAGDELRASDASHVCGLSEDVCRTVLEGLERVGLMAHPGDDLFIRKTLEIAAQ